jgi:hypothetical protein
VPAVIKTIAGAALTGLVLGSVISWMYDVVADEPSSCRGFCLPPNFFLGWIVGIALVVVGCWVGFSISGVRSLTVSVPLGVLVFGYATAAHSALAGGRLHPLPVYSLVTAAALAFVAAAVTPGFRIAGGLILAVVLVAPLVLS